MKAVEEFIEVNGLRLAVMHWGPSDGPPVLCLHGWLDNAHSYLPLSRQLPEHRLVALELPGHGRSQHRPPGAGYHQLDWILTVVAAADVLGFDRFSLLGHSMGAGIAALTAGTCPERIERLVLLEGTGGRSHTPEQMPEDLATYLDSERQAALVRHAHRGARFDVAVRARLAFADPLAPASAELLCQRAVVEAPGGVMFGHDRRLQRRWLPSMSEPQLLAFLGRIACPTLLVLADQGIAYDQAIVERRCAAIADLTRVQLIGGHHVHMDAPERVAPHLRSFLPCA